MATETPWALVTGASGGIGEALARCFAEDGCNLMLVARSQDKLEALAANWRPRYGIAVQVIAADLAQPGAADAVFGQLVAAPSYLVNNAGVGLYGRFQDTALAEEEAMVELNIMALTRLCKLCLPAMLARGEGRILNVASTAAFQPGPYMAVYYATKAYVLSLSEAMAEELKGNGVTVTALCPGPTASGFQAGARMKLGNSLKHLALADADEVARAGYRAMMAGRRLLVPGLLNKLMVQGLRLSPRRLVTALVARLSRPA
ncbi:SDR family oxidoreductase [Gallaecimonas kandeliae]|uniref:SDR family NAD(P)-dependent oxidoreductase n=1 Tax=Gallaecimonas kandeliae TaxID=3029055 RepID=UPI0026476F3C|nr:SDR family oxidoreductase [Gallaecimonas kandeliae]WKE65862.1 SDR family oxidoreductase [Gallaecimonas kandeliae]